MTDTDLDPVADESPATKLVYQTITEADPELTQKEIRERTHLEQKTVYYALVTLEESGIVDRRPNPSDLRQSLYSPKKQYGIRLSDCLRGYSH